MSILDKPDLRMGFWLGLGVVLAFLFIGVVRYLIARFTGRHDG